MMSICALCKQEKELMKSHLIPAWAYKRLKLNDTEKNDPISISKGSAYRTSKQYTKYLLCRECEQLFSKYEKYVARLTKHDGTSSEILRHITPLDTPKSLFVELGEKIDSKQLSFFAISMIWRSSVMHRGCQLGKYEEEFRRYLIEGSSFTSNAILYMGILTPSPLSKSPQNFVEEPSSVHKSCIWYHRFLICGLVFRCAVGKTISPEQKKVCLTAQSQKKYATLLASDQSTDFIDAWNMLIEATPRVKPV